MGPPVFEYDTCGRCGGTGKHSYNQVSKDICFGCNGGGLILTKRGVEAQSYFRKLLEMPASDVCVGMRVAIFNRNITVKEIRTTDDGHLRLISSGSDNHTSPSSVLHIIPSKDQREEYIALALDYQKTLTKTGKISKRTRAA
jgi:hypothetical protein